MDGFKDRIRLALRNVSLDVIAEQRHFVNITLKAILIYGSPIRMNTKQNIFPVFVSGALFPYPIVVARVPAKKKAL